LGNLFKQHGSLFWPDFGQKQGDKSILLAKHLDIKAEAYKEFNLTLPWEGVREPFLFTESGQMLFDRLASWAVHTTGNANNQRIPNWE